MIETINEKKNRLEENVAESEPIRIPITCRKI